MKVEVARDFEYTPAWNGNREDDEPVVFLCKYLTVTERNRFFRLDSGKQLLSDYEPLFVEGVKSISNLQVGDDEIKTPRQFLDCPDTALLNALFTEIVNELIARNSAREDRSLR